MQHCQSLGALLPAAHFPVLHCADAMCHADEDWDHLDWSKAPAIQEIPVTSAIISPRSSGPVDTVSGSKVKVHGYAVAGGGREVIRVDVSGDGGDTWQPAQLSTEGSDQGYRRHWAWRHWTVRLFFCCFQCNRTRVFAGVVASCS